MFVRELVFWVFPVSSLLALLAQTRQGFQALLTTSTGCTVIQPNSDSVYLGLTIPQAKNSLPQDYLTPDISCKTQATTHTSYCPAS